MNTNTLPPVDLDSRPKIEYLLKLLSLERLDRAGAQELKPLLAREYQNTTDQRYKSVLARLIKLLNDYISEKINLMPGIDISNVANLQYQ